MGKNARDEKEVIESGSAVKVGVYYFITHILVSGLSFLSMPIFARLMDKEAYGYFSNFAAWETILVPIVTLNLRATITKSKYKYDDKDTFLSSILAVSTFVTVFIWLLVELNVNFFEPFFEMDIKYIRILLLNMIFSPAFQFQQVQYRMYNKYKLFVFYSVFSSMLRVAVSVLLVNVLEDKLKGRIYGYIVPALLFYIIIYINIWRKGKKIDWGYIKWGVQMAIPLIPSALSSTLLTSSDQIVITRYCGSGDTANYAVAYSVSSIAAVIWTSMNQAWAPWYYDHINAEKYDTVKEVSIKFQYLYAAVIVGVMLVAPEIVQIMGGKDYREAIWVMPPVILAMVFQFYYAFYYNIEYFFEKTLLISAGTLLAAIVNIVLNLIFVPKWGYIAAGYTTLIGYIVMLLYHFFIVKYVLKKSYIYDNKRFFITVMGLICLQIAVAFLYNYTLIRAGLIVVYIVLLLAFAVRNKSYITSLMGQKKGTGREND